MEKIDRGRGKKMYRVRDRFIDRNRDRQKDIQANIRADIQTGRWTKINLKRFHQILRVKSKCCEMVKGAAEDERTKATNGLCLPATFYRVYILSCLHFIVSHCIVFHTHTRISRRIFTETGGGSCSLSFTEK